MRSSGILMPVFSLAGPYGIGTLGKQALAFVDFLKEAGQRYWQILPLNPTNYGDSPYQSFSCAAGNPYFIDLESLTEQGILPKTVYETVDFGTDASDIDYGKLYKNRLPVLRQAVGRFRPDEQFDIFCREQAWWLDDYALFMALKDAHDGVSWREWEKTLQRRDKTALEAASQQYADDIYFYRVLQYLFYSQWRELKHYAGAQGVQIIGDMPIYVADDSADVWAHPDLFDLDKDGLPREVAGCPPDAFSADGQLWGMPVYNWRAMARQEVPYAWWRQRIRHALTLYDVVRIDHFRGFDSYYCIPYGAEDAKKGRWRKGPGKELFDYCRSDRGGELPIIAEDLGLLTPSVRQLLEETGFPGMKVMQFAFDPSADSDYLPHKYASHCVVYTGTHDNDTVMGWTASASPEEVEMARRYLHVDDREGFNWAMIRTALMSVADTAIIPMADFMGLGSEARINLPSTVGQNWRWRIGDGCVNGWLARIIRDNTALYGRLPPEKADSTVMDSIP